MSSLKSANQLQDKEINFNKYKEAFDGNTDENRKLLCAFIKTQAESYKAQLESDLNELTEDEKNILEIDNSLMKCINKMQGQVAEIKRTIQQRQHESANVATDIEQYKKDIEAKQFNRKEMKEVKRQLSEAYTKEMKTILKKNLAQTIKMYNSSNDKVAKFVLDSLTQFMVNDTKASFEQNKKLFANVEEMQLNIRAIKDTALSYKIVEGIMIKISGSADNVKGGEMTDLICDDKTVKQYLDVFPAFKTLSKLCHWSMNAHKDNYAEVKVKNLTQAIIDKENAKGKNDKVIAALNFSAQIEEQIKLLTDQEKPQIDSKKSKIQESKKAIEQKLANFNSHYFN